MSPVKPFLLINRPGAVIVFGPQIGHVIIYCTGLVLDRVPHTKKTRSFFFFSKLWILVNGT